MIGHEIYDSSSQILLQWHVEELQVMDYAFQNQPMRDEHLLRFNPSEKEIFNQWKSFILASRLTPYNFLMILLPLKNCRWSISKSNIRQKLDLQSDSWNMQLLFFITEARYRSVAPTTGSVKPEWLWRVSFWMVENVTLSGVFSCIFRSNSLFTSRYSYKNFVLNGGFIWTTTIYRKRGC